MKHCASDNFACLFDAFAGTVGASPMALALACAGAFIAALAVSYLIGWLVAAFFENIFH